MIDEFLDALPPDRREALTVVRNVIAQNLQPGFEAGILYGMPSWYVPLSRYPETYNGQPLAMVSLAAPKSHMALHLMCVYQDPALMSWFRRAWEATGQKLDMGKSCVRFKKLEAVPLDVVGQLIRKVTVEGFLRAYEASRAR